eukprot:SAG22_NODE_1087_length_5605_cov_7.128224_1_plen_130_part_10
MSADSTAGTTADTAPPAGAVSATINTMIRCRPLPGGKAPVVNIDDGRLNTVKVKHPTRNVEQEFQFDGIFPGPTSQEKVFDEVCKPLVDHVLDGYNSCCFAYGQTGSGKTYSIFGEAEDSRRGIVPRAME